MEAQTQHPDVKTAVTTLFQNASLPERAILRQEGEYWTGGYGADAFRLKDTKGLAYLLMGRRGKQNRDVRAQQRANPDESALVARLRAGDEEAFGVLVSKYYGSLLRFAMTFVSGRSAAEEVVQETWLGVIRGLSSFEGRSSLKTWIFRILANRAKTRGKQEARSIPFSSKDQKSESDYELAVDPSRFDARGMWAEPPRSWTNSAPEELLLRQETTHLIDRAIAELPPYQRAVVVLHDVEGVEPVEICNILEISETTSGCFFIAGGRG